MGNNTHFMKRTKQEKGENIVNFEGHEEYKCMLYNDNTVEDILGKGEHLRWGPLSMGK